MALLHILYNVINLNPCVALGSRVTGLLKVFSIKNFYIELLMQILK